MRAQALLLLEQKQLKILTLSKTYALNFIKIIIGIDKMVLLQKVGYQTQSKCNFSIKEVRSFGVSEIIYTDIEKDGMMGGLNIKATVDLAKE